MTLTTERQTYMLLLRRRGTSISEISDTMDLSVSSVRSCLKGAYAKLSMEHVAEESRELELERIDEVMLAYYEKAIDGDEKAAKLLGLDAPEKKKVDNTFKIGWIDDEQEHTPASGEFAQEDMRIVGSNSPNDVDREHKKRSAAEGLSQLAASNESI